MTNLTRRDTMVLGAASLAVATSLNTPALADAKTADESLAKLGLSGASASADLVLDMPEIAENGNTVPLTVSVKSKMTADDYVKRVVLVADGNPAPEVVTFNFTPASGEAYASTRMRLAKTQNVIAVAETSKGAKLMAKREVKVTIGGCGG